MSDLRRTERRRRNNEDDGNKNLMTQISFLQEQIQQLQLANQELQQNQSPSKQTSCTKIIQYPNEESADFDSTASQGLYLYLSGQISSDNWQQKVIDSLTGIPITIYNPRREDYLSVDDNHLASWETRHVDFCNAVFYWFSWKDYNYAGNLLQLGRSIAFKTVSFVGLHNDYKEKRIVERYLRNLHPNVIVTNNLEKNITKLLHWTKTGKLVSRPTSDSVSS